MQFGQQGRAVDFRTARYASACDSNYSTGLRQVFADDMVIDVGNVDVFVTVHAEVLGAVQGSLKRENVVGCRPGFAGSCDGSYSALRAHDAERVAALLQNVEVALAV